MQRGPHPLPQLCPAPVLPSFCFFTTIPGPSGSPTLLTFRNPLPVPQILRMECSSEGPAESRPPLSCLQPPGVRHPRDLGDQGTPPSLGLADIFLLSLLPYQSSACSPIGHRASPWDPSQACLCQPVASCPRAKRVIVPEGMKEKCTGTQEPSASQSGSDPRAWAGPHSGYSPGPPVPGGPAGTLGQCLE